MSISRKEMNPKGYALTPEQEENQEKLHKAINRVRAEYGKPMRPTSGVRDMAHHKRIYAQKGVPENKIPMGSLHLQGLAIDFDDATGDFWRWCLKNLDLLEELGLFLEDGRWTRTATGGWVHMQLGAPRSGKRIFVPSSEPAIDPDFWNGKYDSKYDA